MEALKTLLLPETREFDLSRVRSRPRFPTLFRQLGTFALLFLLIVSGYALVLSLTYQPVPPGKSPEYTFNYTMNFYMTEEGASSYEQGYPVYLQVMRMISLIHYNYSTNCPNFTVISSTFYDLLTPKVPEIGCTINISLSIMMAPGQEGNFYFLYLFGVDAIPATVPDGLGDYVFVSSGYLGEPLNTTLERKIVSGGNAVAVVISTNLNTILELYIDWTRIYLFALAVSGWVWRLVSIIIWTIWRRYHRERLCYSLIETQQGMVLEI